MQENKLLYTAVKYLQLILLISLLFYLGKVLLVPLFFALFTAIVMCPVSRWLEKKGISRAAAVFICLFIVSLLVAGLLLLLVWQLKLLRQEVPVITEQAGTYIHRLQQYVTSVLPLQPARENWLHSLLSAAAAYTASVFNAAASAFFTLFMIPVYAALFLYHRGLFVQFLHSVIPTRYKQRVNAVLNHTIHTYAAYIRGMIMVYLIVGILNSAGLLALGVRHAVLFGMLCAIMTIIPYLGLVISALLPVTVVWIDTGNIFYPVAVILLFTFVQYLEANIIFPRVVGKQLNLSTFSVLVAVVWGGIIWGVAGMVLFIPFAAMLKIMSENSEALKPLNILLGRK